VDFTYPVDAAQFRKDIARYLDGAVTPELLEETRSGDGFGGPHVRAFWRKLGTDGYFGTGWPLEYGGGGKSLWHLHAFNYEMNYRRLPVPVVTLNTVAPTLMRIGSEVQKREYLPRILRGEVEFSIGYSEPEAGTDLASLQTRAVHDGDDYVINGQKVFTSGAHHADYVWLAARTDPAAPKHRGISIIIVPLNAEGVEIRPLHTMGGGRTNITFYSDVRVPRSALVGEENVGWRYITTQLDFERVAISPVPHIERIFDWLCVRVRSSDVQSRGQWTRVTLARMAADLNVLKVLDNKLAAMVANGEVPVSEASLLKVLSNEMRATMCAEALQIVGDSALVRREFGGEITDSAGDSLERQLRDSSTNLFGGGSNDVQRDIIGFHGLGLPR
jgi:alkylation response protein AidB-like acyl-CoA dehydrogenase